MKTTEFIKYNIDEQFNAAIDAACKLFFNGGVFIYPTDTIYGMGGNPFKKNSVRRITEIKGRNVAKQFIWLVSDIDVLLKYTEIIYADHLKFLNLIYPAPITVILNLNGDSSESLGLDSAAFRIPDNPFCNKLLAEVGLPLISTSVNKSGKNPLNDYTEIEHEFNEIIDALFYTKTKNLSLESTIIDLTGKKPVLIREGTIKFVELLDKFN